MADQNLKDFGVSWVTMGFLLSCLLTFTVIFMVQNNPIGLSDGTGDILNKTNIGLSSKLTKLPQDSDELLNISAKTDPESSFLGSRDSVATSYEFYGNSKGMFTQMKELLAWVFVGALGELLITVFVGLIGFIGVMWIIKLIRNGL